MIAKEYEKEFWELEKISSVIGSRVDYVQGAGGNVSVKIGDNRMAIKASGYRINQVTADSGYVVVDYKNISEFYNGIVIIKDNEVFESQGNEVTKKSIYVNETPKDLSGKYCIDQNLRKKWLY